MCVCDSSSSFPTAGLAAVFLGNSQLAAVAAEQQKQLREVQEAAQVYLLFVYCGMHFIFS